MSEDFNIISKSLPITESDWRLYQNEISKIESQGRYGIKGGANNHYDGRYQMGRDAKSDASKILGIELGHSAKAREAFRSDPTLQDKAFAAFTAKNHSYLMNNSKYRSLPLNEKLAVLGYAHNQGHGGAKTYLTTGKDGKDAFGTKGSKYYNAIQNAYGNGSVPVKAVSPMDSNPALPYYTGATANIPYNSEAEVVPPTNFPARNDFSSTFARARANAGGGGGTFVWQGKKYTTDYANEARPQVTQEVPKVRPQARPESFVQAVPQVRPQARPNRKTDETTAKGRPVWVDGTTGEKYSERSVTFPVEEGGKEVWYTFPTVAKDGTQYDEDTIRTHVQTNGPIDWITGEALPNFKSQEEAVNYAKERSGSLLSNNQQAVNQALQEAAVNQAIQDNQVKMYADGTGYVPNPEDILMSQPVTAAVPQVIPAQMAYDGPLTLMQTDPATIAMASRMGMSVNNYISSMTPPAIEANLQRIARATANESRVYDDVFSPQRPVYAQGVNPLDIEETYGQMRNNIQDQEVFGMGVNPSYATDVRDRALGIGVSDRMAIPSTSEGIRGLLPQADLPPRVSADDMYVPTGAPIPTPDELPSVQGAGRAREELPMNAMELMMQQGLGGYGPSTRGGPAARKTEEAKEFAASLDPFGGRGKPVFTEEQKRIMDQYGNPSNTRGAPVPNTYRDYPPATEEPQVVPPVTPMQADEDTAMAQPLVQVSPETPDNNGVDPREGMTEEQVEVAAINASEGVEPEVKDSLFKKFADIFGLETKDLTRALGYYLMSRATGASHAGSMKWAGITVLKQAESRENKKDARLDAAIKSFAGMKGNYRPEAVNRINKLLSEGKLVEAQAIMSNPNSKTTRANLGIEANATGKFYMVPGYTNAIEVFEGAGGQRYTKVTKNVDGKTVEQYVPISSQDMGSMRERNQDDDITSFAQAVRSHVNTMNESWFKPAYEDKEKGISRPAGIFSGRDKAGVTEDILALSAKQRARGLPDDPREIMLMISRGADLATSMGVTNMNAETLLDMQVVGGDILFDVDKISVNGELVPSSSIGKFTKTFQSILGDNPNLSSATMNTAASKWNPETTIESIKQTSNYANLSSAEQATINNAPTPFMAFALLTAYANKPQ